MSIRELDDLMVRRILCGNEDAIAWIQIGRHYVQLIDDVIDEDLPAANRARGAERMCAIGSLAIRLFSHPFYQLHRGSLAQAMLTCTNSYADSVMWENSDVPWQKHCSDWARHSWVDVVLLVVCIVGGYENMRAASAELRAMSWADHHDAKGKVA